MQALPPFPLPNKENDQVNGTLLVQGFITQNIQALANDQSGSIQKKTVDIESTSSVVDAVVSTHPK